ncbi:PTS sugar transporter subunit IIA [Faecalicoccus pleomorphus]|uniref:PTS sugar transporter subunit IIA n=1 Tax=Faecalicoccus pleomorphus TaxID=1323 RepID=UPI002430FBE1|nr:PTS glucose transporter subunit IIA [Faecalicoccus pleomorphus]
MLNFFNREQIFSPVNGNCIDISDVKDEVFSSKALGDGVGIIPNDNIVCSPVNGRVEMIFRTNHAFGIKTKKGYDLLVHIGVDTVNLNGEGMHRLVNVGDEVTVGDKIIEFDHSYLSDGKDMTVMVIAPKRNIMNKTKGMISVGEQIFVMRG